MWNVDVKLGEVGGDVGAPEGGFRLGVVVRTGRTNTRPYYRDRIESIAPRFFKGLVISKWPFAFFRAILDFG